MIKIYYYSKFKFINIFIFLLIYYNYIYYNSNTIKEIKVCLCTFGKNENKYAREFIQHYINYGVDKIFIYDNNDINDEHFETNLNDYIRSGYVSIINYRGKSGIQQKAFNDCYQSNKNKFDWFILFDMDEFIYLKDYNNIKKYLNQTHFNKCNVIYLNHVMHNDNNHILYYNSSLFERFPEKVNLSRVNNSSNYVKLLINVIKSIVKGNLYNLFIQNPHTLNKNIKKSCNGFGELINHSDNIHLSSPDYEYYFYDHYYFKSSEEFIKKITKGDGWFGQRNKVTIGNLFLYFSYNELNEKKIKFFEDKTGLNLSIFRNNNPDLYKTY